VIFLYLITLFRNLVVLDLAGVVERVIVIPHNRLRDP